jgi:hypothetical protein
LIRNEGAGAVKENVGDSDADIGPNFADPIMRRALAVHPSPIAVDDLIRDLAGSEDDPGFASSRDGVLKMLDACEELGLLRLIERPVVSVVATDEAFEVKRMFIE